MSNQEQKVQNAANDAQVKRFRSIRQSALYHGVSPTTVAYRVGGRKAKTQIERKSQRFTNPEEKSIVQWLNDLQRQHISPSYQRIRVIFENLLRKKAQLNSLGKHFITRFVSRYSKLKGGFCRNKYKANIGA
jgi:DNA mismatch repair ATPase MutS